MVEIFLSVGKLKSQGKADIPWTLNGATDKGRVRNGDMMFHSLSRNERKATFIRKYGMGPFLIDF